VQPIFKIDLHIKDLPFLKEIQSFFGVGKIVISNTKSSISYSVCSIEALNNIIIPHFNKYPLITQKKGRLSSF
jgi:hypothetical protein